MNISPFFENIKEILIDELNSSKSSLKIALAYFNDQDLFNILCKKAAKGVKVELILSSEDLNLTLDFHIFVKSGGKCFFSKPSNGLMHHKFCIIDDSILITGSYNWTNKAASSNFENIVLIKERKVIDEFLIEFNNLLTISETKITINSSFKSLGEIFDDNQKLIEFTQEKKYKIESGYKMFDDLTVGFNNSGLYTIVSRPSVGSTSLVLNIISNLIDANKSILILSLDLTSENIIKKLLSLKSLVKLTKFYESSLSKTEIEKIKNITNEIKNKELFVDETPDITTKQIELLIIKLGQTKKLDLIVIDNLDLMKIEKNNDFSLNKTQREFEVECILRELKRISKNYNIPILLNTHLIKESDSKNILKTPRLSDTVSCIEHYSDVMLFLYRPELYGYNEDEEGNSLLNILEVIIARNKFGNTGQFKMKFEKDCLKLAEFKSDYQDVDFNSGITFVSKMNEPLEDSELY